MIFYYGIFPETEKALGDHGVTLHHLCTWWEVLAEAAPERHRAVLGEVEAFLRDPHGWRRETHRHVTRAATIECLAV